MTTKKKRPRKPPEPFWNELVEHYFSFCKLFFSVSPTFSGSAPRDLKLIVETLHKRCVESGKDWTLISARDRLWAFLKCAYDDPWLKNNFLLSNINRQKDKIFFNAAQNALAQSHPIE